MAEETTQFRLVLCRCTVRRRVTCVLALLYPLDAGRWAQPVWSFRMSSTDVFPPVEPTGLVEVRHPIRDGQPALVSWGSGSFHTSHPVRRGVPDLGGRLFAQHGDELRHPALGGPVIGSGHDVPALRSRTRRQAAAGVIVMIVASGLLWLAVASEQRGNSFGRLWGLVIGAVVAGPLLLAQAAKQRLELRTIDRAVRGSGRPMVLRLRWAVGTGFGATALAELREPGAHPRHGVEFELGVVNVPDALIDLEERDIDCIVHGDLSRGIVAIDVEGARLLPAPRPYRNLPPG